MSDQHEDPDTDPAIENNPVAKAIYEGLCNLGWAVFFGLVIGGCVAH